MTFLFKQVYILVDEVVTDRNGQIVSAVYKTILHH